MLYDFSTLSIWDIMKKHLIKEIAKYNLIILSSAPAESQPSYEVLSQGKILPSRFIGSKNFNHYM